MNKLREAIRKLGPASLTTAELLAVLRAKNPTDVTVDAARDDLRSAGSLRSLVMDSVTGLAARELVTRALREALEDGPALTGPRDSAEYLKARLSPLQHEVFAVLFLDNRNRVVGYEEMFTGTIDGASVHPREVVRAALKHNAAAVILAHNHPSGVSEPSAADRNITHQLRDALQLIGTRVLDHLVVGYGDPTSMAARGLI